MPVTEQPAHETSPQLACENLDDGLYIHRWDPQHGHGTRVQIITDPDGEQTAWVHAEDFMEVQRQRDEYRKFLALINATPSKAVELCVRAGFSAADAEAMRGLIAWAHAGENGSIPGSRS
jgi:hypothetical protein